LAVAAQGCEESVWPRFCAVVVSSVTEEIQ